jgi:HlyD family secretion protein
MVNQCPPTIIEGNVGMTRPSFSRVILPVLAVLGIILAAIMVFRSQPDRSSETPSVIPAMTPASQRASGSVAGAGVVEPSSELIEIGTPIGGVVEEVFATVGEQVAVGQPLFRIDTRDARAAVAEAAARVESARKGAAAARASLAVTQNQFALYRNIGDPRAVSRLEIIDRQGGVTNARAQLALQNAQISTSIAELNRLQTDLGRRTIRARIAGQLLQVNVRKGEFANAGSGNGSSDPLITMGNTTPLYVRIDIDEDEIDRVALGKDAVVSPRGNARSRVSARFVRVEPQVIPKKSLTNDASERVDVRVLQLIYALPSQNNNMFVGQQIDAFIPARGGIAK